MNNIKRKRAKQCVPTVISDLINRLRHRAIGEFSNSENTNGKLSDYSKQMKMKNHRRWQLMVLMLIVSVLVAKCSEDSHEDHKEEEEAHEEDGGEKKGGEHHSAEGHKGEKGYKEEEEYDKGKKGSHGKEEKGHHFDEVRSSIISIESFIRIKIIICQLIGTLGEKSRTR